MCTSRLVVFVAEAISSDVSVDEKQEEEIGLQQLPAPGGPSTRLVSLKSIRVVARDGLVDVRCVVVRRVVVVRP